MKRFQQCRLCTYAWMYVKYTDAVRAKVLALGRASVTKSDVSVVLGPCTAEPPSRQTEMQAWQVRRDRNSSELNKWLLAGGWTGRWQAWVALGAHSAQLLGQLEVVSCPSIVWKAVMSRRCGACHYSNAVEYPWPGLTIVPLP